MYNDYDKKSTNRGIFSDKARKDKEKAMYQNVDNKKSKKKKLCDTSDDKEYKTFSDNKPSIFPNEEIDTNKEFSQYLANRKINLTTSGSNNENSDIYERFINDHNFDNPSSSDLNYIKESGEYFSELSKARSLKVLKADKFHNDNDIIQECDSLTENSNDVEKMFGFYKNRDLGKKIDGDCSNYVNPNLLVVMGNFKKKLMTVLGAYNHSHLQMKKALESR